MVGIFLYYRGCLHNFCLVCCDNLLQNYKSIAGSEIIAKGLMLDSEAGTKSINHIVSNEEVNECRATCDVRIINYIETLST
jgi:hypothetical protein